MSIITVDKAALKKVVKAHLTSLNVWLRTTFHAGLGGAIGALGAHITKPEDFPLTMEGVIKAKTVAAFGAATALIHLYLDKPKPKDDSNAQDNK